MCFKNLFSCEFAVFVSQVYFFSGRSPSASQSEAHEDVKEQSCSEKKTQDVCLKMMYLHTLLFIMRLMFV